MTARWRHLNDGTESSTQCDALVLAIGYTRQLPLLDELGDLLSRDERERLQIDRHYRVATTPALTAPIWVQGFAERSHGLSDTLLSLISVRAGEIAQDLLASLPVPAGRD